MKPQALDRTSFEEIEAYLMGSLSIADQVHFESRMVEDPDFHKEVEVQRENLLAVEFGGFSRNLQRISNNYRIEHPMIPPERGSRGVSKAWVMGIAAGIALFLGMGWWFLARPDAFERVLAEHFVADPGLPVPMSATNDAAFHDAMVDYKMGEYPNAIAKWNILLANDPHNDTLRYYLANAQIGEGHLPEAIQFYTGLATDSASEFREKAEWRLFLSYVQMRDTEQVQNFKVSSGSRYAAEVYAIQELLKE